jgi:cytochrome c556
VAVVLAATISVAAMTATEAIKQRQHEMEGVLEGMKALGAIAKKQQPFDAEVVTASAAKIAGHLERSTELFPEGSDAGEIQTWAKPEIWAARENFDTIMGDTIEAAIELQSVTEADAFPAALGTLGNGCKSCHDLYRAPRQ